MVIKLKNQTLPIGQLKSGKINKNILSETELSVIDLVERWLSGNKIFKITTSGSTGQPREITISRKVLEYSAQTSLTTLDPDKNFKNSLLCINPKYIGGMMVAVRALVHDLDLSIVDPGSNPVQNLKEQYDLASMVPLQLQTILDSDPGKLSLFKTVLIGGANLSENYQSILKKQSQTTCYQTYGMTETASHIALKNVTKGDGHFTTLGDITIDVDGRKCLKIKGTVTEGKWIQTNDVVEIVGKNQFTWKGRADFVINSGGVKIHPERIEATLSKQIPFHFFVTGIPDNKWGEKVVLVIEQQEKNVQNIDLSELNKYERPKEIIYLPRFDYTETGKINRLRTIEKIK